MYQYRGIVSIYRQSDGLSMIPDDPNTLTIQSDDTNNAPREPLHGRITWNPACFMDTLRLLQADRPLKNTRVESR